MPRLVVTTWDQHQLDSSAAILDMYINQTILTTMCNQPVAISNYQHITIEVNLVSISYIISSIDQG